MKITWFCIPGAGHVNPTLGLIKALTNRGHEVYYFCWDLFKDKLEEAGAKYISCEGYCSEFEKEIQGERIGKDLAYSTKITVEITLALKDLIEEKMEEIHPDLVISDSVALWGKMAALKYGLPYVCSNSTFVFNEKNAKYFKQSPFQILKFILSMGKLNQILLPLKEAGYPIENVLDLLNSKEEIPTLVYTSEYFQPGSEGFSDNYHFIGPSLREIRNPYEKKAKTTVYVSMGSVLKDKKFYENCKKAFKGSGYQVLFATGKTDQMAALTISDVFITHCGMNSVSEALSLGIPLLLYPKTPEEETVAKRVEELGAGILLKNPKPEKIREKTKELLYLRNYRMNAEKIAASFKNSRGTYEAVEMIEALKKE